MGTAELIHRFVDFVVLGWLFFEVMRSRRTTPRPEVPASFSRDGDAQCTRVTPDYAWNLAPGGPFVEQPIVSAERVEMSDDEMDVAFEYVDRLDAENWRELDVHYARDLLREAPDLGPLPRTQWRGDEAWWPDWEGRDATAFARRDALGRAVAQRLHLVGGS